VVVISEPEEVIDIAAIKDNIEAQAATQEFNVFTTVLVVVVLAIITLAIVEQVLQL